MASAGMHLAALPVLVLCALALRFRATGVGQAGWRHALLLSSAAVGCLLVAFIEVLSLMGRLTVEFVAAAWMAALVGAVTACVRTTPAQRARWRQPLLLGKLSALERWLVACVAVTVLLVGLTAWLAAPNNFDSMSYHLARVMHWVQNKNVSHYPTAIDRQLYQPPWSEFAILNFQLLAGSDRLANAVQWMCMLGSAIAVSLIAKELGAGRPGQLFAALVCATIPMGVLQGSSTQNDYAVAYWLASLAYFVLVFNTAAAWRGAVVVGACLGLAILTKGTAYIVALPFLSCFAWRALRGRSLRAIGGIAALVITAAAALNIGIWSRNQASFGTPLGVTQQATEPYSLPNVGLSPAILASNVIRNIALHVGVKRPEFWNAFWQRLVLAAHAGLGISADDPRTTWTAERFEVGGFSRHEDFAGNPLHLALVIASIGCLAFVPALRRAPAGLYVTACALAFVFFCAYLKWQPWNGRLHLPLFVLLSPWVAAVLSSLSRRWVMPLASLALLAMAMPQLLANQIRPLIGKDNVIASPRVDQYFANRPALVPPYRVAAELLLSLQCRRLGLVLDGDAFEYPLWVLLAPAVAQGLRIEHVALPDPQPMIPDRNAASTERPCAIFSTANPQPAEVTVAGRSYRPTWLSEEVSVYLPQPQ